MKLVTRYVVREHVGPLVFALSALTSLLMLQYVARQLANLAGKGLPWKAIAQFFVLSLPFTVAMTLPMAVLVATLYAFGRMAAEHEITAFKASGVRVRSLMFPVLVCAFLLSLVMVAFNDQVLPRANHRLRILQQDIARTKPTLALRDQVLNAITEQFFMRVARSDAATNRMWDVVIYDLTKGPERKTIYADSGLFLLAPNGKDLQLMLYDGRSQEFVKGDARRFQRTYFRSQVVQVRGITQNFESSRSDMYKGDREMSVCEMDQKYRTSAMEYTRIRKEYIMYASRLVKAGTKTIKAPRDRPAREKLAQFYCVTLPSLLGVKAAHAQGVGDSGSQPPVQQPPVQQPPVQQPPVQQQPVQQPPVQPPAGQQQPPVQQQPTVQQPVPPTPSPVAQPGVVPAPVPGQPTPGAPVTQARADSALGIAPSTGVQPAPVPAPALPSNIDTTELYRGSMMAANMQLTESRESLDSLAVEIHKKFALSFACLVFVLFGPPIALRFPRGGVGVTLGVSIVVFGLYYVCLMAGEALADKGRLPASVAMWIANVIFTLVGIMMLWRVESTTDSSRGGGLREWWRDRAVRRTLARERAAAV
ncbi:MAG: LptF/LptG family permease [Gemmatimonadaceae bacterium]|nr:LptF/LptG family permease [Gemmatimonadaceae bacterium]